MKHLVSIALLVAALGCNANQVGQMAPALEGTAWVRADGAAAPVDLSSRWTLLEFFSPT